MECQLRNDRDLETNMLHESGDLNLVRSITEVMRLVSCRPLVIVYLLQVVANMITILKELASLDENLTMALVLCRLPRIFPEHVSHPDGVVR